MAKPQKTIWRYPYVLDYSHIFQSGPSYLAIWSNHKCNCILLLLKFRRCISQITSFQIIRFNNKKLNFVTQFDNKSGFKRSITKVVNFSNWISTKISCFALPTHFLKSFNLLSCCICALSKLCFLSLPNWTLRIPYFTLCNFFAVFCNLHVK